MLNGYQQSNMHANFRQSSINGEWNRYMVGLSHRGVDTLNKQVGDDFQTLDEP